MSVTIIDRRVVIDEAESITGWTGVGFGVISSDIAEEVNAVADGINIGDASMYYTAAGTYDLSDDLIYVYSFNNALQNNWDNIIPPQALLIGDGTNRIGFHMSGNNKRVFSHLTGPTTWMAMVLDGSEASLMDAAGLSYADAGSFASLNLSAIQDFGCYFETLSKALGGGFNVATDIIRIGKKGVFIVGGTTDDPGTFSQIALADSSRASLAAHGILRAYTTIAYGVQGPLTIGKAQGTIQNAYFTDNGSIVVFEDRNIANDKYFFFFEGQSGSTTEVRLSNVQITTAGPHVAVSAGQNIDVLDFNTVTFSDLKTPVWLPTDSASYNHNITSCTFTGMAAVSAGTVPITSTTFSLSTSAASGALVWNNNISISDSFFNNSSFKTFSNRVDGDYYINGVETRKPSGFGIRHPEAGTFTYDNLQFTNNDADIYFPGRGTLTINATNGSNPSTYRVDFADATVDIQLSATLTLSGIIAAGVDFPAESSEVRIYQTGTQTELDGIEDVIDSGDGTGSFAWTYNAATVPNVDIVIHHIEYEYYRINNLAPSTNSATIPISQQYDRNYDNPA